MSTFIFIGVAVLLVLITSWINYAKRRRLLNKPHPLKQTGKKIDVQFDDCEVKTREYYEELSSDHFPSRIEIMNSIYPGNTPKQIKKSISVIIYRYKNIDGSVIEFRTEPIYISEDLLRYSLANKVGTVIYVDPANINSYYFDVEFLHKK